MTVSNMAASDDTCFVLGEPKKHPQRTSIQHWQLRDLIACPTTRKEFIFVNQNNVNCYNTETKALTYPLKELSFTPTSIATGCGYLAAGGQRSQLMIRQLNSSLYAQTAVGGSINNAMCISQHLDDTRLLIANNDETIKVYSLPSLSRVTNISLPTAVNYCAVSPDGRKMVAAGDSNQVFVYEISSAAGYRRIASYTTTNDAGFSVSWNQRGDQFAVATQDGFCCVWDIRSSEKLAKLGAKQHPQVKGAIRSCKYAPTGSIDLLMFSEHVSYVTLVDARTFNQRQTLRVAAPNTDQHVSGISFSPDSASIFVGMENAVLEYDIDTTGRRTFPKGSII